MLKFGWVLLLGVALSLRAGDGVGELLSVSFAGAYPHTHYSASVVGGDGFVYGTGMLPEKVDFGGGVVAEGGGIFLVKYDKSGQALRAWSAREGYRFIRDLYVDTRGNFYALLFGLPERENFRLIKRDADFEALWEVDLKGFDVGETTFFDDGYVLTSGEFEKRVEVAGHVFDPVGRRDMICLLFDPDGELVWAKTLGREGASMAGAGALAMEGELYFSGGVKESFSFDGVTLEPGVWLDDFVMRVDAEGKVADAVGVYAGEPSYLGRGLRTDGAGGIYVTGMYKAGARIGEVYLENRDSVQNGYVAKLNGELALQWMVNVEVTEGILSSLTVAPDGAGRVFVTGMMTGALEIGEQALRVEGEGGGIWFLATLDAETGAVPRLERQSRSLVFQMVDPLIGDSGELYALGRVSGGAHDGELLFARMSGANPVLGYTLWVEGVMLDGETGTLSFDVVASPAARIAIERRDAAEGGEWERIGESAGEVERLMVEDGVSASGEGRLYRARVWEE